MQCKSFYQLAVNISSQTICCSKVPNKHPLLLGPNPRPRLLIFGFASLAAKKIEQCKTYLSIRNSIK